MPLTRLLTLGTWLASSLAAGLAVAADTVGAPASLEVCPRPGPGSPVAEPKDVRSENGVLRVDLTVRNERQNDGATRYCYQLPDRSESPTLRLKPGDLLILRLTNALKDPGTMGEAPHSHQNTHSHAANASDPCTSGAMTASSANLHFHGLTIPPVCHQDDVIKTSIQPTDPPFEYRFRIPDGQPPGLYWYHPHIHGFSSRQVLGGASGALIVEGLERAVPEAAGLPERILVIRDQELANPKATPSPNDRAVQALIDRDGDAANTGTGTGQPAKDLSVNFVPVPYPDYPPAPIQMKPGQRELWRLLNASSVTYLNIAALYRRGARFRRELIGVVAIDGVPLNGSGNPAGHSVEWRDSIVISPGARVEFILTAPPAGVPAMLVTRTVNTGAGGENDPNRPLLAIVSTPEAPAPPSSLPIGSAPLPTPALPWLGSVTPVRTRKLYFSEETPDPGNPADTRFYLTVEGQAPVVFDPTSTQPNIVVKQGEVEDWIIENRSTELHAFHIHQIHFQVLDWLGFQVNEPFLRDTINIPFYSPSMNAYPTVRLRMDFRDPNAVGTFLYHCHLLDHEDGGMMGMIRVEPAEPPAAAGRSVPAAR